jgi:arylsulfatase A-like enzyme
VACLGCVGVHAAAERPNILVIYLDDMGWGQPGINGGKLAPTPHLDSLARNGARFTNGYSSACVCSPSRVGVLTGRYQQRSGHDNLTTNRRGNEMLLSETTIAQRLKDVGYTTGIFGKWHLGDGEAYLPPSRGFDHFFGTVANLGEVYPNGHEFYRGLTPVAPPTESPVTAQVFAADSLSFIDARGERPFFLYLALHGVHSPYVASPRWLEQFAHVQPKRLQLYAALIAETDEAIGKVLAGLRARGLEEKTLIFCIGDNGGVTPEADQGGLRGQKWLLWEGGIRVPFFVQWKGHVPAGRVIDEPVMQIDVLPTALAAAGTGVKSEWKIDGLNILPLASGAAANVQRTLFWRYGPQFAVRRGTWKLIHAGDDMKPMLIDLASDPGERRDVAGEHSRIVMELQTAWQDWNVTLPPPRWDDPRNRGEEAKKRFLESIRKKK